MVPRDTSSDSEPVRPPEAQLDPLSRLFLGWRRLLTRLLGGVRGQRPSEARVPFRDRSREALAYLREPSASLGAADGGTLARLRATGIGALALGCVLLLAVGALTGASPIRIVLDATWLVVWACARLVIMRLVVGRDRGKVDRAWGPALIPEAFAFAFPFDLAALVASAWLTERGLIGIGTEPRRARAAVAWAFGGQLVVAVAAWVARGGLIALIALRT
jgi:hypothetical protein